MAVLVSPTHDITIMGTSGVMKNQARAGSSTLSSKARRPSITDELAVPHCPECKWKPDTTSSEWSSKTLRQAIENHLRRNHISRHYRCKICNESFKNGLDDVKPHVIRNHPMFVNKVYRREGSVPIYTDWAQDWTVLPSIETAQNFVGSSYGSLPTSKDSGYLRVEHEVPYALAKDPPMSETHNGFHKSKYSFIRSATEPH